MALQSPHVGHIVYSYELLCDTIWYSRRRDMQLLIKVRLKYKTASRQR
jgi:hypothetical protein